MAFFIKPTAKALQSAMELNTSLWGGTYNPIIPLYANVPRHWKEYPRQRVIASERALGFIRAFDPDLLVNCTGGQLPPYITDLNSDVIPIDEIWPQETWKDDGSPKFGVGIFELLNGIYREYFEQIRRFPKKIIFPPLKGPHKLFWTAFVGKLPSFLTEQVNKGFSQLLDITHTDISPETCTAFLRLITFSQAASHVTA